MKDNGISVAKIAQRLKYSETTIRFHLMSKSQQRRVRVMKLESYHKNK